MQSVFHIASLNLCPPDRSNEYEIAIGSLIDSLNQSSPGLIIFSGNILYDSDHLDQTSLQFLIRLLALCQRHQLVFVRSMPNILDTIVQTFVQTDRIHFVSEGVSQIGSLRLCVYDLCRSKRFRDVSRSIHVVRVPDGVRQIPSQRLADLVNTRSVVLFDALHLNSKLPKDILRTPCILQQSFLDVLPNGYVRYDVSKKKADIIKIDSPYGFVSLMINPDKTISYRGQIYGLADFIACQLPLKMHLRIDLIDLDQTEAEELLRTLSKDRSVLSCKLNRTISESKGLFVPNESLQGLSGQVAYLRSYMKSISYNEVINNKIVQIHSEIHSKMGQTRCPQNLSNRIKLIEMRFSNILCYGKGNIINFAQMGINKTIAIRGKNYAGKSSLLDIILFCLFDRISRPERENIINNKAKRLKTLIFFSIGTRFFLIRRRGYRIGQAIQTDVRFQEVRADRKPIADLTKEKKTHTNKLITTFVGSYDSYVSTVFVLHKNRSNILEEAPIKQKRDLCRILGLDMFDRFHEESKRIIAKKSRCLKRLRRKDLSQIPNRFVLESSLEYYQQIRSLGNVQTDSMLMENLGLTSLADAQILQRAFPHRSDLFRLVTALTINDEYDRGIQEIPLIESQLDSIRESNLAKKKIDMIESELSFYEMYNSLTHINKIPFDLLKTRLPLLEKLMRSKLKIFGDYDVRFVFNDREDSGDALVDRQIEYKSRGLVHPSLKLFMSKNGSLTNQLGAGCGLEKMIADITFRLSLAEMSESPIPNIFVIDEELSYFDSSYLPKIRKLLELIKSSYDHVLLISHNEHMMDFADGELLLERVADSAGFVNNTDLIDTDSESDSESEYDPTDLVPKSPNQKVMII